MIRGLRERGRDDDRAIAEAMAVYPYASQEVQGLMALPREPDPRLADGLTRLSCPLSHS